MFEVTVTVMVADEPAATLTPELLAGVSQDWLLVIHQFMAAPPVLEMVRVAVFGLGFAPWVAAKLDCERDRERAAWAMGSTVTVGQEMVSPALVIYTVFSPVEL